MDSVLTFSIEEGDEAASGEEIQCSSGPERREHVGGPGKNRNPDTLKTAPWNNCFAVLQCDGTGKALAKHGKRGSSFLTSLRYPGPVSHEGYAVVLTAAHVLCHHGTADLVPVINLYHSYDLEHSDVLQLRCPGDATPFLQLDYGCQSNNGCYRVHPNYKHDTLRNDVGVIFIRFDVLEQKMMARGITMDSGFIVDPQLSLNAGDAITATGFPAHHPMFYSHDMKEDTKNSPRNHRLVKHDGVFKPIKLALPSGHHDLAVHLVDTSSGSSGGPVFTMRTQQSSGQAVAYALAIHFRGAAHQQFKALFPGGIPADLTGRSGLNLAHWITDDLVEWCQSTM